LFAKLRAIGSKAKLGQQTATYALGVPDGRG